MKILAYDHHGSLGKLFKLAQSVGVDQVEEKNVKKAAKLLAESDADVLLAHLGGEPTDDKGTAWGELLSNLLAKEKTIFRFSTSGFPPVRPAGVHKNGFHVCTPTDGSGALTTESFAAFHKAVSDRTVLDALSGDSIPTALGSHIRFEKPHLARALHILLQAMLAQWAAEPRHSLRNQAGKVLGCCGSLPSFSRQADWASMLRKLLGSAIHNGQTFEAYPSDAKLTEAAMKKLQSELGIKEDAQAEDLSSVAEIIKKILQASPDTAQENRNSADNDLFQAVQRAYEYLDLVCNGQRKKGK